MTDIKKSGDIKGNLTIEGNLILTGEEKVDDKMQEAMDLLKSNGFRVVKD